MTTQAVRIARTAPLPSDIGIDCRELVPLVSTARFSLYVALPNSNW